MWNFWLLLTLMVLSACHSHGYWDFAVTAKTKILFYDEHWQEVTSSAHQFDELSAIAFDEAEEIIYFADREHNNGSVFSLRLPHDTQDDNHIIDKIVKRTQNETITGIAYDPLERNVYWADQLSRKIYFSAVNASEVEKPKVLVDFSREETIPDGIAIDICRRRLYWTNVNFKNASIERIDLSGENRKIIINEKLYLPHGIVVDQLSDRIYWVVDQQGVHFTVESANLDGKERKIIVKGLDSTPTNLAITNELLFWTDTRHNAIWMHLKKPSEKITDNRDVIEESSKPLKVMKLKEQPSGIVARSRYLTNLQKDEHCAGVVKKIKHRLFNKTSSIDETAKNFNASVDKRDFCLNDGEYLSQSGMCLCNIGFRGMRCETNDCHNYCIHGTCSISSLGFQKCACQRGFYGKRCESSICDGYCLNNGVCKIETNGEPSCECQDNFGGQRCDQNSTEICALFCRVLKYEPDTYVPFGCHDICEELSSQTDDGAQLYAIPTYKHLEVCKNQVTWTNTLIIVLVAGVVSCLCLVLLIVHGVRRFYKPARPRIKKTFVVRRQPASSDTPLTNRPIATEQCEITIENCCNMNYCDTPCFDPKMVEKTLSSRDSTTKEDKKILIHNMEDDLY